MKFVCLGYFSEADWNRLTPQQRDGFMEGCFSYDDELRGGGHFADGFALQSVKNAVTVRARDGKAVVTDGPYIETKEQMGGILVLEARDLNHAIQLMQRHPGVLAGGFEIRPLDEPTMAKIASRGAKPQGEATCIEAKPADQHRWLQQFVGAWTCQGKCMMGPDQPVHESTGRETVRRLGNLWIMGEGTVDAPGQAPDAESDRTILTLGFDPQRGRFVGTFTASNMTHMWQYDGSLDAAGKVLTLNTTGPNFVAGGMAYYQDIIERIDENHRTLRSRMLGEDGQWRQIVEMHYHRVG
jgi:hypothetical protein